MKYTNITNNLALVLSEDKTYKKAELLQEFQNFLSLSNYKIEKWINKRKCPYEVLITDSAQKMTHLILYLKNITGAGWKEKPNIKRVQVSNVKVVSPDNFVRTSKCQTIMILGYYNFDNNPIMVGWDAYRYTKHKTMRSCYVNVDNLIMGYENKYYEGISQSQKIWIFDSSKFNVFLNSYIKYNLERNLGSER